MSSTAIQPRVCGDYIMEPSGSLRLPDTTPRVRGLRSRASSAGARRRYNPACAGTTDSYRLASASRPIQPRVCGDYVWQACWIAATIDTTPRVRGLLRRDVHDDVVTRYTPACAGTTSLLGQPARTLPIQPRVCGDYPKRAGYRRCGTDTTPRVRGLPSRRPGRK